MEIIDPCENDASIISSTLSNQEYTITDTAKTYKIPAYTPSPSWCSITYTYQITDSAGDAAVSFDSDEMVRIFTFDYTTSLDLSGQDKTVYKISVKGSIGYGTIRSEYDDFELLLKNPC